MDFIKDWAISAKEFFETHFSILLLLVSVTSILLFYIISRIVKCGSYNSVLSRKLKKLNIIIRQNQITEDREKFLKNFNKEVSKKQKTFSPLWDQYLKDETAKASETFKNANIKAKKVSFLNFFLLFSLVVSFAVVAIVVSLNYKQIAESEKMIVFILIPIFIISLSLLFNSIYFMSAVRNAKKVGQHLDFFISNIDDAVKGFVKNDFVLSSGSKPIVRKDDSVNVTKYEDFVKAGESEFTSEDEKHLQALAEEKLASQIVSSASNISESVDAAASNQTLTKEDDTFTGNGSIEENDFDGEEVIEENDSDQLSESGFSIIDALNKLQDANAGGEAEGENANLNLAEKVEASDDEGDVDQDLESLIKAKKRASGEMTSSSSQKKRITRMGAGKIKTYAKRRPTSTRANSAKTKTAKGPKTINDALEDLLKATKRSMIRRKDGK